MALENVTFLDGVALDDGSLLLGAQNADYDIEEDPHTLILNSGDTENDRVVLGGQLGTILMGRGDDWREVDAVPDSS